MNGLDQSKAKLSSFLRVSAHDSDCFGNQVGDTLPWSVPVPEKLQVFDSVVVPIPVPVMHGLFGEQIAPEMLSHDVAVLKNLVSGCPVSGRDTHNHVFSFFAPRDLRQPMFFSVNFADPFVFALLRAKTLLHIYATALVAMALAFFAAVYAGEFVSRFCISAATRARTIHRAVQRFAIKFLFVRSQVRLHHRKIFTAFFAGEVNWRSVGRIRISMQMFTAAGKPAVFASFFDFAGVAVKRLLAILTLSLDRHRLAPLFRSNGILAMSVGHVK